MRTVVLAMAAFAFAAAARADEVRIVGVTAEGSEFKATLADGRVLRSADLVGTVLRIAGEEIRIDAVERDPGDKTGSVWLHRLSRRAPDGRWHDHCLAGPDGLRAGFPLAGGDRADGTLAPGGPNEFVIVCSAGARGKCARFGYRPWAEAADGTKLRDAFNACVRMLRADYCGDGTATTRDGTIVDVYDRLSIQSPDNDPAHEFEAGWGPDGAVCVRHVRVREATSLDVVAKSCPRLAGKLGPVCTEEAARRSGAIVFNRSRP